MRNALVSESKRPRVVLVNRCFILNSDREILFVRRSVNDQHMAGYWEVPGGKLEEEEDLVTALSTEVLEETGLQIIQTFPLAYIESYIITTGRYSGLPYVVIFSIGEVAGNTHIVLSQEHDNHLWRSLGDVISIGLIKPEVLNAIHVLKDHLR